MTSWTGVVNGREVTYDCIPNPTTNNPTPKNRSDYRFEVKFLEKDKPVIEMYIQTRVTNRVANNMEANWKAKLYGGNVITDFINGGLQNIKTFTPTTLLRWTSHNTYSLEYKVTIHYDDFNVYFEKTPNKAKHYNNKSYTYGCWYTEVICQKNNRNNGNYKIIIDEPNNSLNSVFYGLPDTEVFQNIVNSFLGYTFEIQFQPSGGNSYQKVVNYNEVNQNYEIQYAHTNSVLDIPANIYTSNKMDKVSYLDWINFFNTSVNYPSISKTIGKTVAKNLVFGRQNGQPQIVHIATNNVNANGEVI